MEILLHDIINGRFYGQHKHLLVTTADVNLGAWGTCNYYYDMSSNNSLIVFSTMVIYMIDVYLSRQSYTVQSIGNSIVYNWFTISGLINITI